MAAIRGPFGATINDYIHSELKYENDLPYELLTKGPSVELAPHNRYVNVAETLREAMSQNQALKVFVAAGYYDFATPFFAADPTFDHLGLDPALRKNITLEHYEAGHMMYIHKADHAKLKQDVTEFMEAGGGAVGEVESQAQPHLAEGLPAAAHRAARADVEVGEGHGRADPHEPREVPRAQEGHQGEQGLHHEQPARRDLQEEEEVDRRVPGAPWRRRR